MLTRNDDAVSPVFLQSKFWADFKALAGWTYTRYQVAFEPEGEISALAPFTISVMERSLGASLRFAYMPHGPATGSGPGPETRLAPADRGELLLAIAGQLRSRVSRSCLFIRFDPAWYEAEDASSATDSSDASANDGVAALATVHEAPTFKSPPRPVFGKPFLKASDVQPPDSVVLAIQKSDDEILAGMKTKWRYNIRLSAKKGVVVASEGAASLGEFYTLYETTSARDHIAIHPRNYYERLFALQAGNAAEPKPDIRLWIARYEGQALAAIITVYYGGEATYLYGASSDAHRNLMPAYALQWAAIRAAREAGCSTYDFYGIPPVDDPAHAMSGLYRFKTGFGGEIRHYAGAWDYVLLPATYTVFRFAERARLFWHKTVKKRIGV
jgi:lipid II:glycine glycyltransferase (peptidoglycan interpeptide bridge formation enzyme)